MSKLILSLFDYTGNWSRPYLENGYDVIQIDLELGQDILTWDYSRIDNVYGILAAPPCTHFASSGASYWYEKDKDSRTENHLALIDRTLEIVKYFNPRFWVLENPVGRLHKLRPQLGLPVLKFHPWHYGDPYEKETWLWGKFEFPSKANWVRPIQRIAPRHHSIDNYNKHHLGKTLGKNRTRLRQATPMGFARMFFEANR